jgi:hypothetical protein
MAGVWRRCSACKQPIEYGAVYWVCSVSTCNRKRTGMVFCSDDCWGVHLPVANHREAWTVEKRAPSEAEAAGAEASGGEARPKRRILASPSEPKGGSDEVLIVASRLKSYIKQTSGMNTSDGVLGPLSEIVRKVCQDAIRNAERDGRKTVLDRDVPRS